MHQPAVGLKQIVHLLCFYAAMFLPQQEIATDFSTATFITVAAVASSISPKSSPPYIAQALIDVDPLQLLQHPVGISKLRPDRCPGFLIRGTRLDLTHFQPDINGTLVCRQRTLSRLSS